LDTDPSIAVERIHRRDVPIQPHENCEDLEVLRNEFVNVLNAASKGGFEIVRINTDKKNLETVVGEMERVLKEKLVLVPKAAV
jgi:thymidylate kinase